MDDQTLSTKARQLANVLQVMAARLDDLAHITHEDLGGHCLADVITLPDGRILVVDSEAVGLYASRRAFDAGKTALDMIDLTHRDNLS